MTFQPYIEIETRSNKKTDILLIGIVKIVRDNEGNAFNTNNSFPRIFITYSNNMEIKLDFNDNEFEFAEKTYSAIKKILENNILYLVENKLVDQFFVKK